MKNDNSLLPLISIIVPMYNVEKYIPQCIESILGQSYKNLDIILVNDGSPDKSGEIAEEYSEKFNRIRVIHSQNRGVSVARNLGIDKSIGEYIIFVDGDDYLAIDYVEYMYSIAIKTGACFVMSKNCFKFPGNDKQIDEDKVEIFTSVKAATDLLYPGYIEVGCWNKMFKREFVLNNNMTFPVDFYMGEGLNFIISAAQLSNCVGVGRKKVYYYRKNNPNSATKVQNVPKYFNALAAIDNIENNVTFDNKDFQFALNYHRYLTIFSSLQAILKTKSATSYKAEYKEYLSHLRNGARMLIKVRVSIFYKVRVWAYCIQPRIAFNILRLLSILKHKFILHK